MSILVLYPDNFEVVPSPVMDALEKHDVVIDGSRGSIELRFCHVADPARARDIEFPHYTWRWDHERGCRVPGGTSIYDWVSTHEPELLKYWSMDS